MIDARQKNAQRLREQSESAARAAYERQVELQRQEAARIVRMKEIQLMEAQKSYEIHKERTKSTDKISTKGTGMQRASSEDLEYLNHVPEPVPTTNYHVNQDLLQEPSVVQEPSMPPEPLYKFDFQPTQPVQQEPQHDHQHHYHYVEEPTIHVSPGPKYYSESGTPLRALMVPDSIVNVFLKIASKNTKRGIETCGVLAGKLAHNKFTITHLIVPKQEGTEDQCAMVAEEDVLMAQDQHDLLTLGWIHTHPTQQCFLSSIDLHTHFPYQLMMAEAIAIVVAPTQSPNYGIFRLTDPPGLDIIARCPARGFHPHPSDQGMIYRALSGPESHAQFGVGLPLDVIDLR